MVSEGRRSVWWVSGAAGAGLVLPSAISMVFAFLAFYPIGSALPPFNFLSGTGAMLAVVAAAGWVLIGAALYSLLIWSWRPFALSLLLVAAMSLGFVPGLWSFQHLKLFGYDLLGHRSAPLIGAIHQFERERGGPPLTIADLTPRYLPSMPNTGMAAYPDYEYAPEPGPCPNDNRWHVKVDAGEVLKWDFFFYCPKGNYTERGWGGSNEVRGNWAYLHE